MARYSAVAPVLSDSGRGSWRAMVVPFVVSRLWSGVLVAVMAMIAGRNVIHGGFGHWDGRWYAWIAAHGYLAVPPHAQHHQTPWPFFPLLPVAMKGVSWLVGVSIPVAGIAVNHIAFFVALVGVQRIALRHTSRRAASFAVWIIALGPFAFIFSMIYPSALFLAASVWAFLLVEERNDFAAGVAVAAAALARPDGIIVAVVLLFVVHAEWTRVVRIVGPAIGGLSAWAFFNFKQTGDPLRFLHAKRAWHEVDLLSLIQHPVANAAFHLAVAGLAITLVALARRALPQAWSWFTVLYLVPSLALGVVGLGRYATETFPPVVAGGALLERHEARTVALTFGVLVVAQTLCAYFYISRGVLL